MNKEIPAGYQLHVTTWENDADDYKTEILSGLSEIDVRFYLSLARAFESSNGHNKVGLGNDSLDVEKFKGILQKSLKEFPLISEDIRNRWTAALEKEEEEEDEPGYFFCELLADTILSCPGDMANAYENFVRVFDRYEVYYLNTPIENVTKQF